MKRVIISLVMVAMVFGLSGCFKKKPVAAPKQEEQKTVYNSLSAWVKSGKGIECKIDSPEGGDITIQIKDKMMRMVGFPYVDMNNPSAEPNMNGVMLTVGDWTYMWAGNSGTKFNAKRMQELAGEFGEDQETLNSQEDWEEMIKGWEDDDVGYKCEEKRLSEGAFTVPGNVEFSDLTAMMEGFANMGKQLQEQQEAGGEIDMEAIQKQTEDLRKQYGIEE